MVDEDELEGLTKDISKIDDYLEKAAEASDSGNLANTVYWGDKANGLGIMLILMELRLLRRQMKKDA